MLADPKQFYSDPVTDMISSLCGNKAEMRRLQKGCYQIGHFSSDIALYGHNGDWNRYDFGNEVPVSGVCDSPEQFLKLHERNLEGCKERVAVFFTHVKKDPSNRGRGGGWRWHKWGEYIGEWQPECEYLDDEDGFENGIYVFRVHDIDWKREARK